jgi:putative endonuclease
MTMNDWFVYIVRCADDSLYTGITKDVGRRVQEHNEGDKLAAKYTRARLPVVLVYQETCESRSVATKREIEIKQLSRKEKIILLGQK